MKKVMLLLAFLCVCISGICQFIFSGRVLDKGNEPLIGANIVIERSFQGSSADLDGKFSIRNLKDGIYTIKVSYIGYETIVKEVEIAGDLSMDFILEPSSLLADEVIIKATRADNKVPVAYSNVGKEDLREADLGQDMPYLLKLTPSLVASSDAGAGIGYTIFRIRGTDMNRINITANGIPVNNAESHGVWWVDLPDFASSVDNVQIQRGVGTSTNGAGAFGATINLQTTTLNKDPYAEVRSSTGSFNTFKNSISVGSGMINDHYTFDARMSKISSDGYIDRANSDLNSYYLSGAYYHEKNILRINVFSGKEITYQAWDGVPGYLLETNRTYNGIGEYTGPDGESRYYENETDNYRQDHYQLLYSRQINKNTHANMALFYTKGFGFYEQYKEMEKFGDYNLEDVVIKDSIISQTDLIRRKILDNDFYGITWSLNYKYRKTDVSIGGSWSKYDGDHFGKVIWAHYASNGEIDHKWYDNNGLKKDFNVFGKLNYQVSNQVSIYGDIQYRLIDYKINGKDDDQRDISQQHKFSFINPKFGVFYDLSENQNIYLSVAVANREPNRDNYIDAHPEKPLPTSERLYDYEMGYTIRSADLLLGINLYYMNYKDQLVLTGEINDVGAAVMTNINKSYRAGIELTTGIKLFPGLNWDLNATFSSNKIKDFTEYVDNWSYWDDPENEPFQYINELGETDLAFSPGIIAGSQISYEVLKDMFINLISKYVGNQYIDNTSSVERSLEAYFVNDIRIQYLLKTKLFKELGINLFVNNIFSVKYETNAWIYRYYIQGEPDIIDGYFPQAGINFLAGLSLQF